MVFGHIAPAFSRACVALALAGTGLTAQRAGGFCAESGFTGKVPSPVLMPVDEAGKNPEFFVYRARLQAAIAARDVDAVIAASDPNIKLGFGGEGGAAEFRKMLTGQGAQATWTRLSLALSLGGSFSNERTFEAPYIYSRWPDGLDAIECAAVVGTNVIVRSAGRQTAEALGRVNFSIVRVRGFDGENKDWSSVETPAGVAGFVHSSFLYSPLETRAIFSDTGGRWLLRALVAGD
jgi:hypothetical protein